MRSINHKEQELVSALADLSPSNVLQSPSMLDHFIDFITRGSQNDAKNLLSCLYKHLSPAQHRQFSRAPVGALTRAIPRPEGVPESAPMLSPQPSPPQRSSSPSSTPLERQDAQNLSPAQLTLGQVFEQTHCNLPLHKKRHTTTEFVSSPPSISPRWAQASPEERLLKVEHIAKEHFTQRLTGNSGSVCKKLKMLVRASKQLIKSEPLDTELYQNLWNPSNEIFPPSGPSRIYRLGQGIKNLSTNKKLCASGQRLTSIFSRYEIDVKRASVPKEKTGNGVGRASIALMEYAAESGREVKKVKRDLGQSTLHMNLLKSEGPGHVVGLDESNLKLWKKSLRLCDLNEILLFRKLYFPAAIQCFKKLDSVAAQVIIKGLRAYGWEFRELSQCKGELMEILFRYIDRNRLAEGCIEFLVTGSVRDIGDDEGDNYEEVYSTPDNAGQADLGNHEDIMAQMTRRDKEVEDLLAAQAAELEQLRKEAAKRAAQDVERVFSQEADEGGVDQQDHDGDIVLEEADEGGGTQSDEASSDREVHPDQDVERSAQQEEMVHHIKETEDLLAAQAAELERLRREAAERPAQDVERELSQGADEGMMELYHDEITDGNDGNLDEMLRDDAEQRAAGDHDAQDRARLEAERAAAKLAEQERLWKEAQERQQRAAIEPADNERQENSQQEEERTAQERAMALAQLQTTATQPEAGAHLTERSQVVTQLDLPSLIARWREWDGDDAQLPRNTRAGGSQRRSRAVGIQNTRMKARSQIKGSRIRQAAIRETKRAAVYDHLGWDLEKPDPTASDTALPQVEEETGGNTVTGMVASPAKNNRLEYNPARSRFEKLTRGSMLMDPSMGDDPWPSHLSVPSVGTGQDQASGDSRISITLYFYERHQWKVDKVLLVDPSDPSLLEKTVWGYKRREIFLYDMKMQTVSVSSSFRAATADGANSLLLIPQQTRKQMDGRQAIEPPSASGKQRSKRIRRD